MNKVLFFARLRDQLECAEIDCHQASKNVNELYQHLVEANPQWENKFNRQNVLVAVNQTISSFDSPIQDGDEVAFFPPVTGG